MLKRGEFRYMADCVMIGIGVYRRKTQHGKIGGRGGVYSRVVTVLSRVLPLSREYNYVEMGWNEAHEAAVAEATARNWKIIRA